MKSCAFCSELVEDDAFECPSCHKSAFGAHRGVDTAKTHWKNERNRSLKSPRGLGTCPKCQGEMKWKTIDFNPLMLLLPGFSPLMKVVRCRRCGYEPQEWQGKPNRAESRWF